MSHSLLLSASLFWPNYSWILNSHLSLSPVSFILFFRVTSICACIDSPFPFSMYYHAFDRALLVHNPTHIIVGIIQNSEYEVKAIIHGSKNSSNWNIFPLTPLTILIQYSFEWLWNLIYPCMFINFFLRKTDSKG
jgi:hypothetical protein